MVAHNKRKNKKINIPNLISIENIADEELLNAPISGFSIDKDLITSGANEEEDKAAEEELRIAEEDEIERKIVESMQKDNNEIPIKNEIDSENKSINKVNVTPSIYKKDIMLKYAKEIFGNLEWIETLETCSVPLDNLNVHDDLKREVGFYNNTLESVKIAKEKLNNINYPYKRPDDYFAEMLKNDVHMAKIKDKLLYEQRKIVAVEERKKSTEHKKIAKKIQSEKQREKVQEKKETLKNIQKWKKRTRETNNNNDTSTFIENIKKSKKSKFNNDSNDNELLEILDKKPLNKKFNNKGKNDTFNRNNNYSKDKKNFKGNKSNVRNNNKRNKEVSKRPGKANRMKARRSRK